MIDIMTRLLAGVDNEDDIKRYARLVSLYGVASIANSIRTEVVIPTDNETMPINLYGVGLAGSGISKSKTVNYVTSWIEECWRDIKELGNKRLEVIDPFQLEEINDMTKDGVSVEYFYKSITDASLTKLIRILDIADYGSVNLIIDEFASVIGRDYELLSSSILEIFDRGRLSVNLRATNKVKRANNPIPFCFLGFGSSHLLFESDTATEKLFMDLLQTGLARRSIFVNVKTTINKYTLDIDSETSKDIALVKNRFKEIVSNYDHKTLSLTDEAKKLYRATEKENIEQSALVSEYKAIQKIYCRNIYWLALKISGIYAVANLHNEVTKEDYLNALEVVNDSYNDLISIVNRKEKYELLVDYLLEKGEAESEYTLTKELPFYKEIKNKRQFLELAKGYAYDNNITLQIQDKRNITFYNARGKVRTDLEKPLLFSYSEDMAEGYFTNETVVWRDFYKVLTADGICYSAHSFKDGKRSNDTALTGFQLIILDIDGGVDLETAKILFSEYTYLIATTRNHQKEKNGKIEDRFRIILPMEYTLDLDAETYTQMMKNLFEDLPIEVDKLSDIGRMFFSSAESKYWYNDGVLFNADKYIPHTQEEDLYKKEGVKLSKKNINGISQWCIRNQSGGRNNTLIKLAFLLVDKGFTHEEAKEEIKRVNQQFDSPLSQSELERTIFKSLVRKEEKIIEDDEDDYYDDDDDVFNRID